VVFGSMSPEILARDIKDWVKAKVKVGKDEVHFYKNLKTNEVYYEMDYKTKFGGKK